MDAFAQSPFGDATPTIGLVGETPSTADPWKGDIAELLVYNTWEVFDRGYSSGTGDNYSPDVLKIHSYFREKYDL